MKPWNFRNSLNKVLGCCILNFNQEFIFLELGEGQEEIIGLDRVDPGIISDAISAGASLLNQGDGSHSTYQMPSGARFDANDCWQVLTICELCV